MIAALPDYKVRYLRADSIAQIALLWRSRTTIGNQAYFNIIDFIERALISSLVNVELRVQLFDAPPGGLLACVTFKAAPENGRRVVILKVDKEIWELAKAGDPAARFILAHEIGHIVLHNHDAKAFSKSDDPARIKFADKEETAEWQADTFALCFLMPAKLVIAFDDAESLAKAAAVEMKWATERFRAVTAENLHFSPFSSYPCERCGEFKMSRQGIEMKCECGFSKPVI